MAKIRTLAPITDLSVEHVRFDTQKLENPEISGVEYQQGTLLGYGVREYLLEKWGRACVYCGATDVPLQVEHLIPKSRGGSNRIRNLTLACEPCNRTKGKQTAAEFGHPDIQAQDAKAEVVLPKTLWGQFPRPWARGRQPRAGITGRANPATWLITGGE